jgi:protein TonB
VAAPAPPAPAPPPPPAPSRNVDDGYLGELRGYLNGIKRYPNSREARQLKPQGTVKVWIELDRAGQVLGAGVHAGSGSLILDNEALRTVRNGRYPAFPADAFTGQSFHRFVVPIEYVVEGG